MYDQVVTICSFPFVFLTNSGIRAKVLIKVFVSFSGFSIVPHSDWVLQVGVEYDVSVQIYTRDNHKVYITDVRIFFELPDIIMQAQVSKIDVGSTSYPGRFSLLHVNSPYRLFPYH